MEFFRTVVECEQVQWLYRKETMDLDQCATIETRDPFQVTKHHDLKEKRKQEKIEPNLTMNLSRSLESIVRKRRSSEEQTERDIDVC